MKTLCALTLATTLLTSSLVSFGVSANSSDDPKQNNSSVRETFEQRSDKHQDVKDQRERIDDEDADTLDGDAIPEGTKGDSTDQTSPGGAHGDGRTDPGMLE